MSGVGEIIAIVSCVAGLIEAIDAGHRIVKQIKERRKAHRADGALPPSDELEQTLEEGKNNIQKLVEKGNKRFGTEFEEGDGTTPVLPRSSHKLMYLRNRPDGNYARSPFRYRTSSSTA